MRRKQEEKDDKEDEERESTEKIKLINNNKKKDELELIEAETEDMANEAKAMNKTSDKISHFSLWRRVKRKVRKVFGKS